MKKYVGMFIVCIAIIGGMASMNSYNSHLGKSVLVENVEALSQDETVTDHYWCCGHTGTCAKGDNLVIIGKFSTAPCQ